MNEYRMLKGYWTFLMGIVYLTSITGQTPELFPCGTPPVRDEWRNHYLQYKVDYRTGGDSLLQVPLKIHLLGLDDGSRYNKYRDLMRALCQLNEDFALSNIQFYIYQGIDSIAETNSYNLETILEGADLMFAHNDERAINCYILGSAAQNCGFNLPYAGIVLAKNCIGANQHTWAHELGHNLSLPHPFLGWEGHEYDYNTPTPRTVVYNYTYFKDSLITDTIIYDTAVVELLSGSNCSESSDKICDTPPDYLSQRWRCNENGESITLQKDYEGRDFRSDGSLFMSYSSNDCQTRFTPEEIGLMRATILYKKAFLLDVPPPEVVEVPEVTTLLFPEEDGEVPVNLIDLKWSPVPGATQYFVQVSLTKSFSRVKYQTVTEAPEVRITSLTVPKKYYWRVFAYGSTDYCSEGSYAGSFTAKTPVKVKAPNKGDFSVFFTAATGTIPQLHLYTNRLQHLDIKLFDMTGRRVFATSKNINGPRVLPIALNYSGAVILQILSKDGRPLYQQLHVLY